MADRVTFFCENCGRKVSPRDKICPHCGKFFSKVRCPSCGFQGNSEEFFQGCPKCSYMGSVTENHGLSEEYETAYFEKPYSKDGKKYDTNGLSMGLLFALVASIGFLLAAVFFWLTGRG